MPEPKSLSQYRSSRSYACIIHGLADRSGKFWGNVQQNDLAGFWKSKLRQLSPSGLQMQHVANRWVVRLVCGSPLFNDLNEIVNRVRSDLNAPTLSVRNVSPDQLADSNYLSAACIVVHDRQTTEIPRAFINDSRVMSVQALRSHARAPTRLFLLHCKSVELAQSIIQSGHATIAGRRYRVEVPHGAKAPRSSAAARPAGAQGAAAGQHAARAPAGSWASRVAAQPAQPAQQAQPAPVAALPGAPNAASGVVSKEQLQFLCQLVMAVATKVGAELPPLPEWFASLVDVRAAADAAPAPVMAPAPAAMSEEVVAAEAAVVVAEVPFVEVQSRNRRRRERHVTGRTRARELRRHAGPEAAAAAAAAASPLSTPAASVAIEPDVSVGDHQHSPVSVGDPPVSPVPSPRPAAAAVSDHERAASAPSSPGPHRLRGRSSEPAGHRHAPARPSSLELNRQPLGPVVRIVQRGEQLPVQPPFANDVEVPKSPDHDERLARVMAVAANRVAAPGQEIEAAAPAAGPVGNAALAALACTICMSGENDGPLLTATPCRHAFHHACLGLWLPRCSKCPDCRQDITEFAGFTVDRVVQQMSPNAREEASREAIAVMAAEDDAAAAAAVADSWGSP